MPSCPVEFQHRLPHGPQHGAPLVPCELHRQRRRAVLRVRVRSGRERRRGSRRHARRRYAARAASSAGRRSSASRASKATSGRTSGSTRGSLRRSSTCPSARSRRARRQRRWPSATCCATSRGRLPSGQAIARAMQVPVLRRANSPTWRQYIRASCTSTPLWVTYCARPASGPRACGSVRSACGSWPRCSSDCCSAIPTRI